ncbi:unnamed protein product, partial [Dovyalis caffra]
NYSNTRRVTDKGFYGVTRLVSSSFSTHFQTIFSMSKSFILFSLSCGRVTTSDPTSDDDGDVYRSLSQVTAAPKVLIVMSLKM